MTVLRFRVTERCAHWTHAATFFGLLFTGLFLLIPALRYLEEGYYIQHMVTLHLYLVLPFFAAPGLILLAGGWRGFKENLRELTSCDRSDLAWMKQFPQVLLGRQPQGVEIGKFNAGQKLHAFVIGLLTLGFSVTGGIMATAHMELFPRWAIKLSFRLHDLLLYISVPLLLGHLFFTLIHPRTRESLHGMLRGYVSLTYAQRSHSRWAAEKLAERAEPPAPRFS